MTSAGARVAEDALDADLLAERRAAAHAHREVGDLDRGLARRGLALEHAQHRVGAAVADRGERVGEQRLAPGRSAIRMRAM